MAVKYTEYLKSDGAAFIWVPIVYDASKTIRAIIDLKAESGYLGWDGGGYVGVSNGKWHMGSVIDMQSTERTTVEITITGTQSSFKFTQSGNVKTSSRTNSISANSGANGFPLFGITVKGGGIASTDRMIGTLYSAKFYENGALKYDLAPCVNQVGTPCLYDKVSSTYLKNSGGGSFTAGAEMANAKLGTKAVGSIVKLKVNGTAKEFIVVHQGKPSSLYDDSCSGTWLLMKDIYEKRAWHSSNSNSYKASTIHAHLNGEFLALFDSGVQSIIKQVKIPYVNGTGASPVASGANGLSAKVFLLGGYELGLTGNSNTLPVDGAKLSYFESGTGTSANNKRIARLNSAVAGWWLRSPIRNGTDSSWSVTPSGGFNGSYSSYNSGIRPALILPSTTLVDDSGNIVTVDLTAHKTLVDGTAYEVKGGKCLVNGTVYSIKKGRTLIGGTGYDIAFEETIGKTWRFNDVISCWEGMTWNVNFVALGYPCTSIYSTYNNNLFYTTPSLGGFMARDAAGNWNGEEYRTVTFDEPPTGDLLAWLQANAVQQ